MYTRIYWIEQFANGAALAIMPRPRGDDWLENEIKRLKEVGVQTILSLLEKHEMQELGLTAEAAICQRHTIHFIHYPIGDRTIPKDALTVANLVTTLTQKLDAGEKIVIHCRMGIGRAAIIAGAVLLQHGYTSEQIIEQISKARELKVPDTQEQIDWLKHIEKNR